MTVTYHPSLDHQRRRGPIHYPTSPSAIQHGDDAAEVVAIVHKDAPAGALLVRGRIEGDIEHVFPGANVTVSPDNDYRYRAVVTREAVAAARAAAVEHLDYANFKSSVAERDRHDAYLGVWSVMHQWQGTRAERTRKR